MSLRLRLALGIAVVLAASLGALGFEVVRSTRSDLLDTTRQQLERSLFNRVNSGPPPATTTARPIDPRGLATAHFVVGRDGSMVAAEPAGAPSDPTPLPKLGPDEIADLRSGKLVTVDSVDGSLRYLVLGATSPSGQLEIEAAPLDEVDATVSTLTNRLITGSILTLLIAVAVAIVALRQGLRPLDDVVATADAVAAGEREQRIPTGRGPSEIRHLSRALDRMLERQQTTLAAKEASEARLRRFISDASHELQTPITSVLGWAQLRRKGALDEAGRATALARIEAESRRVSALVEDMLLLARLDEHRPLDLRVVDLAAIAYDAVTDARVIDPERPISLDAPEPAPVQGDERRLRQVIDNLLRNVRMHTPAGTACRVRVQRSAGEVDLVVEDDGPGIDGEHLDHVFDRFWRADGSRGRATGGTGLGLAIVAALVGAHGGTVRAANQREGGAVFTVRLPSATNEPTPAAY